MYPVALGSVAAAVGLGDKPVWFVASDLQVTDPERGEPLSRRSLYWALGELVKDKTLEKGEPLPAGRKGGKPTAQYRVVGTFSGVATTPAQEALWS